MSAARQAPASFHVMELFKCPPEVLGLDVEERRKFAKSVTKSAGPDGFKQNENAFSSSISIFQELLVVFTLLICMGAPWTLILVGFMAAFTWTWPYQLGFAGLVLFLILHPLPKQARFKELQLLVDSITLAVSFQGWLVRAEWLHQSPITIWMYKYFSFRIVWVRPHISSGSYLFSF